MPPHRFVQNHPDASTSLSCPYCSAHRRRVLALVDESLPFDGDERKAKEWTGKFNAEVGEFREHREECNEN